MRTICLAALFLASWGLLAAEGRVYVKSDPEGADIFVREAGKADRAIGQKTPAFVSLEVQEKPYTIILRKNDFEDQFLEITVDKAGIIKPEAATLAAVKVPESSKQVDILFDFEDGWDVSVDSHGAIKDVNGDDAKTPCTITVTNKTKTITISKNGYKPIKKAYNGEASLRFTGKPEKDGQDPTSVAEEASEDIPAYELAVGKKIDIFKLTDAQWGAIKGKDLTVNADEVLDTDIVLSKGEKIMVLPSPGDKWSATKTGRKVGFKGTNPFYKDMPLLRLCFKIGETSGEVSGIIEGEGKLYLYPNDGVLGDNAGSIRVKVVRLK